MPNFNSIGSGVSEPQVAKNRYLPLTGGIALTTVYALTCYTVITRSLATKSSHSHQFAARVLAYVCYLYANTVRLNEIACVSGACTYSWATFANTNIGNGRAVSDVTTYVQCQYACINDASCTSIDWSPSAPINQQCWKHGPWSASAPRNTGTAAGVTHYDITRNCPGKICLPGCR